MMNLTEVLLFSIAAVLEFDSTMRYAETLYKLGDIGKNEYLETIKKAESTKDGIIKKLAEPAKKEEES